MDTLHERLRRSFGQGLYVFCLSGIRGRSDAVRLQKCDCRGLFHPHGDDAFETKSTTANGLTDNVLFRNNAAWTDKAVAYGCIYESNHDTRNVRFENCSVGFALGTWSNHLGCCVIQMGNRKGAVMENITFDNIEVYMSHNDGLLNVYIGGSGGRGEATELSKYLFQKYHRTQELRSVPERPYL